MTKDDLLIQVRSFSANQHQEWLLALGANLTVSARGAYVPETDRADGSRLRGFNELQHQLYNRLRALPEGREWPLESFLDVLHEKSVRADIWADVSWSLERSVEHAKSQ